MLRANTQKLVASLTAPPEPDPCEISSGIGGTGLVAALIACGVPLTMGLLTGWSPGRVIGYSSVALVYLGLTQTHYLSRAFDRWRWRWLWVYLLLAGLVCLVLQIISGDAFIQPIAFTVPVVYAALGYNTLRITSVAALYLGLMVLGLWLSGQRQPEALIFPTAGYGAFMAFAYVLTRLLVKQSRARRQADQLTQAMARQRDYLARLVEITATLTRDLDIDTVLEQVAAEGRTLARAAQVRVWLREPETREPGEPRVRLAVAVPPQSEPSTLTPPEQHTLLANSALVSATTLVLPLVFKGDRIGALELRDRAEAPFSDEDVRLLQPFADAAAVALENARLYEQAHISATLSERNRLARELHDTIAQGLTAVTMQLEAAQRSFERDPARARARLGRAHELARETLEDVRRSVWTLASPLVDGHTLHAALADLAQRFAARTGLAVRYDHSGPVPRLGHTVVTQVLRIAQEALQNVEKHAQATQVRVGSEATPTEVRVWVCDNGIGFDPDRPSVNGAVGNGFGLIGLRERARLARGALHIQSAPGMGTRVTVTVPNTTERPPEEQDSTLL